jgi:6-phosphogluconolactonase (cycloisomerase 2 family)
MPRHERGLLPVKRFSRFSTKATLVGAALLVALSAAGIAGADVPPGLLTPTNCVSETGSAPCGDGWELDNPHAITISSDGSRVLVASTDSNSLTVFTRGRRGQLIQYPGNGSTPACTSEDGSGPCQDGHAFLAPADVAIANNSVYVASTGSDAIDILNKDDDSRQFEQAASTKGCFSEGGTGGCAPGKGLTGASSIAVNPQGGNNFVYVGGDHSIAAFRRNLQSGELNQLPVASANPPDSACLKNVADADGCHVVTQLTGTVTGMAFSNDGRFLYAAVSGSPGALLILSRAPQGHLSYVGCVSNGGAGGCDSATNLDDPTGVSLNRASGNVYVASHVSGAVTIFSRDKSTGDLTQLGGTQLVADVNKFVVSSNSKTAYATSDAGLWSFKRDKKTGALTLVDGTTDCATVPAPGTAFCAVAGAQGVVPSEGHKDIYVVGPTADAVFAFKHS